ncbi:CoA-transferase subunit beta [Desulfosarcina ovata]|uniref:CoA-transferase subunit beta n=2 Tax=Desulfosarcina ovata TaxID=83564 RepID=A0A5K8A749_9BACT|nr:CoA-transferase [Desulfosarcina ovata]BBO81218.1 CoA-transferase subunit beta [Desulfosarcina ovata subsp. sediminis]BBO88228.1 CoA-transferase subunit beta [Desulfosarcina ovata subsp. ovata]
MQDYTLKEMMAVVAAREIHNGDIIFCGTGISMLAAMAAKNISAPDCVIFFETGAIDSLLEEVPLAVADSRVMYRTALNGGLAEAFGTMQNRFTGKRVVGILGAAQIDRFGNLNSTVLGDYDHPAVRFSGSGGANDVASFVSRTIIFMKHEKRKFVRQLDYLTSPGWLDGPDGRKNAGLSGGGPSAVITDMAVMRFDEQSREMFLAECYPGISVESVQENMGFAVDCSRAVEAQPPTGRELEILRNRCDPQRLILG